MNAMKPLYLYEEILLLALRNQKGTFVGTYVEYALTGALLAELLLERRISIEQTGKQLVNVEEAGPVGDPILDEGLERIAKASRRASLQTWVSRLAGIKRLRERVAQQLCHRGILRADEDKILLIFTRKIYPEIDPAPEKEIVERLQAAIFSDTEEVDPRTVVLISLADGVDLLTANLGRKEVRARKKRIEQIINGELTGRATKEVVAACQAAVMAAAIIPAAAAASINTGG